MKPFSGVVPMEITSWKIYCTYSLTLQHQTYIYVSAWGRMYKAQGDISNNIISCLLWTKI